MVANKKVTLYGRGHLLLSDSPQNRFFDAILCGRYASLPVRKLCVNTSSLTDKPVCPRCCLYRSPWSQGSSETRRSLSSALLPTPGASSASAWGSGISGFCMGFIYFGSGSVTSGLCIGLSCWRASAGDSGMVLHGFCMWFTYVGICKGFRNFRPLHGLQVLPNFAQNSAIYCVSFLCIGLGYWIDPYWVSGVAGTLHGFQLLSGLCTRPSQ